MKALRDLLRERAVASKRGSVRFQERDYQLELALSACAHLVRGRNVVVDLPTGAGKTNVALICAMNFLLRRGAANSHFLYIVPTRVLIAQVVRAGSWLGECLRRVGVTQSLAGNTFSIRGAIAGNHMAVTTPGLFASLMKSGRIDRLGFIKAVPFVVVDEFDEFLTVDTVEHGQRARMETAFRELLNVLGRKPLLLMSGTTPAAGVGLTHTTTAATLAKFTEMAFAPFVVTAEEESYKQYIPLAHVSLVAVKDAFVATANAALKHRLRSAIQDFECANSVQVDATYLLDKAQSIVSRLVRVYLDAKGNRHAVTEGVYGLCLALLDTMGMFTFLFEDMFAGFGVENRKTPVLENCAIVGMTAAPYLLDRRPDRTFHPELRGKASALERLIASHDSQNGVVFTRNTRLSDALEARMRGSIASPILVLDGRLSENQRYSRLRQFSSQRGAILIITRTTGKRGLDIPAADYAVLYSPKEDEYVVWQELSRIRSTLGASKPSYLLIYSGTAEEQRAHQLVKDMKGSVHRYRFADSTV